MKYIKDYAEQWGLEIKTVTFENDIFTVEFADGTIKRYKCVNGNWIPVPSSSGEDETTD